MSRGGRRGVGVEPRPVRPRCAVRLRRGLPTRSRRNATRRRRRRRGRTSGRGDNPTSRPRRSSHYPEERAVGSALPCACPVEIGSGPSVRFQVKRDGSEATPAGPPFPGPRLLAPGPRKSEGKLSRRGVPSGLQPLPPRCRRSPGAIGRSIRSPLRPWCSRPRSGRRCRRGGPSCRPRVRPGPPMACSPRSRGVVCPSCRLSPPARSARPAGMPATRPMDRLGRRPPGRWTGRPRRRSPCRPGPKAPGAFRPSEPRIEPLFRRCL